MWYKYFTIALLFIFNNCSQDSPPIIPDPDITSLQKLNAPSFHHWNIEYSRRGNPGSIEDDMDFWLSVDGDPADYMEVTVEAHGDWRVSASGSDTYALMPKIEPYFIPNYYWLDWRLGNEWYHKEGACDEYDLYLRDTEGRSDYKSQISSVKNSFTILSGWANFYIDILQPDWLNLKVTAKKNVPRGSLITIYDIENISPPIDWERIKRYDFSYFFSELGTYTITYNLTSEYYIGYINSVRTWDSYTTTRSRTLTVKFNTEN